MGLWRRLMGLFFRRTAARGTIPFAPGRIYQCTYRSGRPNYIIHDPRPTVFVLSSDLQYTTGINAHYLGPMAYTLANWIISARDSGTPMNGLIVYQTLKRMYPYITRRAFRKYFTNNLRGRLVSSGMSNMPEPHAIQTIAEPWIRKINRTLRRPEVREEARTSQQARDIVSNARLTSYNQATTGQPYKPVKQRIQYQPPGEGE